MMSSIGPALYPYVEVGKDTSDVVPLLNGAKKCICCGGPRDVSAYDRFTHGINCRLNTVYSLVQSDPDDEISIHSQYCANHPTIAIPPKTWSCGQCWENARSAWIAALGLDKTSSLAAMSVYTEALKQNMLSEVGISKAVWKPMDFKGSAVTVITQPEYEFQYFTHYSYGKYLSSKPCVLCVEDAKPQPNSPPSSKG